MISCHLHHISKNTPASHSFSVLTVEISIFMFGVVGTAHKHDVLKPTQQRPLGV